MAGPYDSMMPTGSDVQRLGDSWSRMGWGRSRPDPYAPPAPAGTERKWYDPSGILGGEGPLPTRDPLMRSQSIELPEHMRIHPPPRVGPVRGRKNQPEKTDKAYKKKLDRLLKEQKKAQKEVREAELELRSLTDELQSDLSGEPRRYRGPQGSQVPVPPPPPPMPRDEPYHQNVVPNPNYNDPFSSQTTPSNPFAAQQRPPEASLVPPGFRQRQWLPEGAYAPPAPPASPQPVPQQQYQYPPWGMRRGNQVNPWAGASPATQQYPR